MISFQSLPFPLLASTTIKFSLLCFALGFLPQGLNSLECYDCVHTESHYPPRTPTDPTCIDPVKSGASKVTCTSPDESCMTATGSGSVGIFGGVAIWVRRCVLPESKKKEPDGCGGVWGKLFLNKTFEFDRNLRNQEVVELILKDAPEDLVTKRESAEGASNTSSSNAKQLGLDFVHVSGDYCICNTKDLCNAILDATTERAKGTISPPTTEDKGAVKEGAPCVITFFSIFSQLLLHFGS